MDLRRSASSKIEMMSGTLSRHELAATASVSTAADRTFRGRARRDPVDQKVVTCGTSDCMVYK